MVHNDEPFRVPLESLPSEMVPVPRPDGAYILAIGLGERTDPRAFVMLRQRRTGKMAMVTGWQCAAVDAPELCAALDTFAEARGLLLIRATLEQEEAIATLGLIDTGRGYAQRWIGSPVQGRHDPGQYVQSTAFTCGPVALAMAMGGEVRRSSEIEIWREATTLIGLTGPGGCDPYGVALAASRRGFDVSLWFDSEEAVLLDRANTEEKKELMRFVQSEFRTEAARLLDIRRARLPVSDFAQIIEGGWQIILLIDQSHTHDHHAPHWILVHGTGNGCFLVNDPWAEPEDGETLADVDRIPISLDSLTAMAAYGAPAYHAAILIRAAGVKLLPEGQE